MDGPSKEISELLKPANDAAPHVSTRFVTFVLAGLYLTVTIGTTDDEKLLRGADLPLPILGVGLPILPFFVVAPLLYVFMHMNLLLKLNVLAETLKPVAERLKKAGDNRHQEINSQFRAALHPFPFAHFYLNLFEQRAMRWLVRMVFWSIVVAYPVVLLLWVQRQFLPYHSEWVTWFHRALLWVDLGILWVYWRGTIGRGMVADSATAKGTEKKRSFRERLTSLPRRAFGGIVALLRRSPPYVGMAIFFLASISITIPDECPWIDGFWKTKGWPVRAEAWLHRNLVLPSRTLVAEEPPVEILAAAHLKGEDDETALWLKYSRGQSLRGRNLNYADFFGSRLYKADLSGAQLQGAVLLEAQLQGANLIGAQLQGAILMHARLQRADLRNARLQRADLWNAQLQGAILHNAQLQEAELLDAQLQRADLWNAQLQGAIFWRTQLQGAVLLEAQLQGADLTRAQLQEAELSGAKLHGADLFDAELQGAKLIGVQLQGTDLRVAQLQGADLKMAGLEGADLFGTSFNATSLRLVRRCTLAAGGNERCWYEPGEEESEEGEQHKIPAAIMNEVRLGANVWRLSGLPVGDEYSVPGGLQLLGSAWHLDLDGLERLRWATQDLALRQLAPILGREAALSVIEEVHQPTNLTGADLTGVYIDQETLDSFSDDASIPPPKEAFKDAITDPKCIEQREKWKFPDGPLPSKECMTPPSRRSPPD